MKTSWVHFLFGLTLILPHTGEILEGPPTKETRLVQVCQTLVNTDKLAQVIGNANLAIERQKWNLTHRGIAAINLNTRVCVTNEPRPTWTPLPKTTPPPGSNGYRFPG